MANQVPVKSSRGSTRAGAQKEARRSVEAAADAFTRASAALLPGRLAAWSDRDLTITQLRVLRHIADSDGLGNMALAERLGLTKSAVSFQLQRLERKGFIRREVVPSDRRSIKILLEPTGRSALNAADEPVRKQAAALLAGLSEDQVKQVSAAFNLLDGATPARR